MTYLTKQISLTFVLYHKQNHKFFHIVQISVKKHNIR